MWELRRHQVVLQPTIHRRQSEKAAPTSQAAAVSSQGRRVGEHEALGALLTAGRRRPPRRALKTTLPVEVAAGRPGALVLPQVFLVVLGEERVKERVDAAVGVRQTRGQVVDVALGFGGERQ